MNCVSILNTRAIGVHFLSRTASSAMTSFVGPDREGVGTSGGEGREDTVPQALGEQSRLMLQDTDEDSACRAGRDDKLDPRSLDTTQVECLDTQCGPKSFSEDIETESAVTDDLERLPDNVNVLPVSAAERSVSRTHSKSLTPGTRSWPTGKNDNDEVSEEESTTKRKSGMHLDGDDEDNSACGLAGQPTLDDFSNLEQGSEKNYDVDDDIDAMPSESAGKCQGELATDDKEETAEKPFHTEKTLFSDSYTPQHWTLSGFSFDFTNMCDNKNETLDSSSDEEDRPQERDRVVTLTTGDSMGSKPAESRVEDVQKKHKESYDQMKQNASKLSVTPSARSDSFVLNDSRKVSTDINTLASSSFVGRDSAVYERNKAGFHEMARGQDAVFIYDRDDDEMRRLFTAIHHGDVDTVARLCRSDKTLLNSQHQGLTPIMLAASRHSLRAAELLLDLGADINAAIPPNRTALGAAIQARDENMCSMLIDRGANLHYLDQKNSSYLHWAAHYDLPNVLWTLVAYGADINAKDKDKDTPLLEAVQRGAHRAMDILLSLPGIDVRAKNKRDFSALHLSSQNGYAREMEKMLAIDRNGVHDLYYGHATPLHLAAHTNQAECARILIINGGANVNHPGGLGQLRTPLHTACHHGNFETVEALLELGADVHAQDSDGDTALHLTIGGPIKHGEKSEAGQHECQMRVAIACMLITRGAYVDTRNKKGRHSFNYGVALVREGVERFIRQNKDIVKSRYKDG